MDLRRGLPPKPPSTPAIVRHRKTTSNNINNTDRSSSSTDTVVDHRSPSPLPKASDALPLPLYLTNGIFFTLFFCVAYFLLHRWRDKIRSSTPLHVVTLSELAAIVSLIASFIYLLGFFGIDFVQSFIATSRVDEDNFTLEDDVEHHSKPKPRIMDPLPPALTLISEKDEEIVKSVVSGSLPSYSLESKLGDCRRAASIRREALEKKTGRSLLGLPLEGFDYDSILGQCCEMPIGYVQLPIGIAGPLLLNGGEYMVPMATTEGCLVASTNRGCKAIFASGGATAILLKDGMTRAPVVRFGTAARSAHLKFFLEDPINFDTLSIVFNKSSRFARLQSIRCSIAGKNLYIRFTCSTGDAMGMNMVSKGVQNVLDFLQIDFPDMDVIGISGSLGGFNAHAANIVSAVFIATGQDPAQNIESSHCITMMEAINGGKDLHISVTMPSIEVGTVGGGTQLASQSACLNLLGVKGASKESPGSNARVLATIVAGAVLAGELSLMSAISSGQLVKSHMKYNRSNRDMTAIA
ncbi:3-hydroxy-3-methylglutaryl-coenzyme A reductase 3-like isoform X2 [Cynara cardunculus var. scolymus]|uniref:3-hydroxy-3-methylglutaryl-coenzyme A reductase 3-like isoform X2 n=1 Tax=Cynara cardunculus var. scolymus TaxID=59895 RepID=UPI000D6281CB|nr:3-hydroxy-3-methylglutaryl-coenzyme A reductase 3-like isoform X2 [Cynara cardunculus var. scolymus]